MIEKFAFFIVFLLDALVYANKQLTDINWYKGDYYHNVIFFIQFIFSIILFIQILKKIKIIKNYSEREKRKRKLFLLLSIIALIITLSYLFNDFILRYWFRDLFTYIFYALIGFYFYFKGDITPKTEYHTLIKMAAVLLTLYVCGIIILTFSSFDISFVINKIFIQQFSDTLNNYRESKLYFFGLAGNEEAYSTLILFLIVSGEWKFSKKMTFVPVAILYFIYLGTRTVFFLYILYIFLIIWNRFHKRWMKIILIIFMCFGIILFAQSGINFLKNSFTFFGNGNISLKNMPMFFESDTLGFRIMMLWAPIIANLSSLKSLFLGLSTEGLKGLYKIELINLTATHNAFLYFFSTFGLGGLGIYVYSFICMIHNYKNIPIQNRLINNWHLQYGMVVFSMIVYALMNNAYSIQGMLLMILVIAFGRALNNKYRNKVLPA